MRPRTPEPPLNVRIERPEGEEIRLAVHYTGRFDGLDVWVATSSVEGACFRLGRDHLRMDLLPAKSEVQLCVPIR